MDERMRSLKDLMKLVANIKHALHLEGKQININKIMRLLLYAMVMPLRLHFLNLHQRLEVYIVSKQN